jgi:hypothetical protein
MLTEDSDGAGTETRVKDGADLAAAAEAERGEEAAEARVRAVEARAPGAAAVPVARAAA